VQLATRTALQLALHGLRTQGRLTKLQKSLKQLSSEVDTYTTNPKPILLEAHVMSLLNTNPVCPTLEM